MNVELPKWPELLVTGKRITLEQADKVIVRTAWLHGLGCNDDRWTKTVFDAFKVKRTAPEPIRRTYWTHRWPRTNVDFNEWDRVAEELGVLDLNYLTNDQITSTSTDGPHGWVHWDGTIGTGRGCLLGKWPEVGEVHEEWSRIAQAFPFLDLTAQLVTNRYSREDGMVEPLVTWTVANGAVEMHSEPGPLIRPLAEDLPTDEAVARMMKPRAECGTSEKRLRQAVNRCRRDMERRGK